MALRIHKPTENRFCKGLFFAPAGAGKTVLLGTAELDERTSPMLLLDFEGGSESLAGLDIDVQPVRSWEDYNDAYEALVEGAVVEFENEDGSTYEIDFSKYKSLGIDSISETHKFALLDILDKEGPSRRDPELLQQGDYGKATVQMRRLLREFRDLPMHVFFVAHAKETEIPREGRVRLPDLAGQMAEEVSGLVSVQGYLAQFEEEGEMHRTLLLHSFPKFRIKARTPWGVVAPEEIVDPTISDVLDALGYGDGDKAAELRERGSSRGKQVEDEVPEEEEGRLPGEEKKDDGTEDQDAENESNAPQDLPIDLDSASFVEMKRYAKDNGIDLGGARNKTKAREAILAATTQED